MRTLVRITYAFLFFVLMLQPHIITGHILNIPPAYAQSLGVVIVVIVGAIVYYLNMLEQQRHERKEKALSDQMRVINVKLLDAFQYIGSLNRRLPLLKSITSECLKRPKMNKKARKEIFEHLLSTMCVSIAKVDRGLLRSVDTTRQRTLKEFIFSSRSTTNDSIQGISNSTLVKLAHTGVGFSMFDGTAIWISSDEEARERMFLILPESSFVADEDIPIIQAIVDQAQLFHKYLY